MPPRNRKGRTAESIARDMIEPYTPTPNPVAPVTSADPERMRQFNEHWEIRPRGESNFGVSQPLVTRVEVIDASGRSFVQHYVQAGVTMQLQDGGRTLKIFAGEPR